MDMKSWGIVAVILCLPFNNVWGQVLCSGGDSFAKFLRENCEVRLKANHCAEFVAKYPEFKDEILNCQSRESLLKSDDQGLGAFMSVCGMAVRDSIWDDFHNFANLLRLPGQPDVITYDSMVKAQDFPRKVSPPKSATQEAKDSDSEGIRLFDLKLEHIKMLLRSEYEKQSVRLACLKPEIQSRYLCLGVAAMVDPIKPLQAFQALKGAKKVVYASRTVAATLLKDVSLVSKLRFTSPSTAKTQLQAGRLMAEAESLMELELKKLSTAALKKEVEIAMQTSKKNTGYLPGLSPDWQPVDVDDLADNFKANPKGSYLTNITGNLGSYSGFRELLDDPGNLKVPMDDKSKKWIGLWQDNIWNAKVFSELKRRLQSETKP